jgi:hypothetical protein
VPEEEQIREEPHGHRGLPTGSIFITAQLVVESPQDAVARGLRFARWYTNNFGGSSGLWDAIARKHVGQIIGPFIQLYTEIILVGALGRDRLETRRPNNRSLHSAHLN